MAQRTCARRRPALERRATGRLAAARRDRRRALEALRGEPRPLHGLAVGAHHGQPHRVGRAALKPARPERDLVGAAGAPWTLTCEDAGGVKESRQLAIERGQELSVNLVCGSTTAGAPTTGGESCTDPNGFRRVNVTRRGKKLGISFSRRVRNPDTVAVFQSAKRKHRRVVTPKRVAIFRKRQRSFVWNGRKTSGTRKRVARGVYYVRFRIADRAGKEDVRRVVVEKRKNGRFYKKGKFQLYNTCP